MKLNEIFEYPVTKPVPYGRLFHIFFAVLQVLALAVLLVWAAATAGYDTVTVASPNFNMTQTLWYSPFIPSSLQVRWNKEGMCSAATAFTPGASFSTSNDLFSYEIASYYAEPGKKTRPSDVVEYKGTSLDTCAPGNVLITVDVQRNVVDAGVIIFCYDVWPIVATNHYTFSVSPTKSLLMPGSRGSVGNKIWTNENSTSTYIFRALDYLATDLLTTAKQVGQQNGGNPLVEYSVNLQARLICPIQYIGTESCPPSAADWRPDFFPDQAVNSYANGNQTIFTNKASPNQNLDLAVPAKNLAIALHSATVYDLGSTSKVNNNIYTTLSTLTASIQTVNTNATTSGIAGMTLQGAVILAADTSFPIPANGPAVVRATYLCRIKQLKSAAEFVIAVVGLAMSLFASLLAVATVGIVMLLRLHRPDLMHCQGHGPECHIHTNTQAPVVPYDNKANLSPAYSPGLLPPSMQQQQQQGPASTQPPMIYNENQGQGGYARYGWNGQQQ